MKSCAFFIICILAFVSPRDTCHTMPRSNAMSSPRSQKTLPSRTKSGGKVPTSSITHRSHSTTICPTGSQKMTTCHTVVPKSSGKVPTSVITHRSYSSINYPANSQKTPPSHMIVRKSSGKASISTRTSIPKTTVIPMTGTTSDQEQTSPSSRGSHPGPSRIPKSSPPLATTTTNPTTNHNINPTITPTLVSASKTLTVSNGQTVSAQVGWMVVGVGVGGAVAVGGNILPIAGGTGAIIEENSSGQDELSTIESDTSSSKSSSTSRSSSRSSSASSSSLRASPTRYNIYPRLD